MFYNALIMISQGEIWCLSLMRFKGLINDCSSYDKLETLTLWYWGCSWSPGHFNMGDPYKIIIVINTVVMVFVIIIYHYYLCSHNPCRSGELLALLVCLPQQFEDRNHRPVHSLEFLFQGSEIKQKRLSCCCFYFLPTWLRLGIDIRLYINST